jgi:hypothetical protein
MWSRTSRRTHESGRAAHVSWASPEGQVVGFHHATRGSATPSAVRQRDRGTPWTAGVRRTLGRTPGRAGVNSTIWRAPTRRTAGTPAWTRRATWASAQRPRSAPSTSPAGRRGWTAGPRARSWVRRGATTSVRRTPRPAWHRPRSRAPGTPHPGRGAGGWPNALGQAGVAGLAPPAPSTRHGRGPCHRPSSTADRGTARRQRARRRAKRRRGSWARA